MISTVGTWRKWKLARTSIDRDGRDLETFPQNENNTDLFTYNDQLTSRLQTTN